MTDRIQSLLSHKLTRNLFIALGGLLLLKIVWLLGAQFLYELHDHYSTSGWVYVTVGRGIVNGLLPYVDLFEVKPPGMFLIAALSFWLTNTMSVANIIQGIIFLAIPLFIAIPVFRSLKKSDAVLTLLFGTLLSLYTAYNAGGFQTESFGSLFGVLYVALLFQSSNWRWGKTCIAAICILGATGLKEPFLFSLALSAIMLTRNIRLFCNTFVIPFCIAVVTGLLIMLMLGYLDGYFSIYLPEMLGTRSNINLIPLWMRGTRVPVVFSNLWNYSIPLSIVIVLMYVSFPILQFRLQAKRALITFGGLLLSLAVLRHMMITTLTSLNAKGITPTEGFLVFIGMVVVYSIVCICVCRSILGKEHWKRVATAFFAASVLLYFFILIIGFAGPFLREHMGFGVPVYAAFFLYWIHLLRSNDNNWYVRGAHALSICVLSVGILILSPKPPATAVPFYSEQAQRLDALLDACGLDRYMTLGEPNVETDRTLHSPLGPGFSRATLAFPIFDKNPLLHDAFMDNVRRTPLIIFPTEEVIDGKPILAAQAEKYRTRVPKNVLVFLEEYFTATPPPCAAPYVTSAESLFLFRKDAPLYSE